MAEAVKQELTSKDFRSAVDTKWCPGCGCFPILKATTKAFSELGLPKEDIAVVSGIGCSSRFPYYVDSYGFHTIHGRAPTVAMGLKLARPDLSVWIVSGDGDCLSIGGNHFIHTIRRNPDVNYLLFNNEIYGLTKGQASPTSVPGTVTKTTPLGSIDRPMQAITLAVAAGATFVARVVDGDLKGMAEVFKAAQAHKGTSFVEILFNCVTFADGVFAPYASKKARPGHSVALEPGKPLMFGEEGHKKGLRLNGLKLEVVEVGKDGVKEEDLIVHDPANQDPTMAYLLSRLHYPDFPVPLGIIREVEDQAYDAMVYGQLDEAVSRMGQGDIRKTLQGPDSWVVK